MFQLSHHHNLLSTFNWNNDNAIESPTEHMRFMHVYVSEHICVWIYYAHVYACVCKSIICLRCLSRFCYVYSILCDKKTTSTTLYCI